MSQDEIYSQADYDRFWQLTPEERSQKLQDEELSESHRAILLFQEGLVFAESKEYEAAILSYEKALIIQPDSHNAWDSRGEALFQLNRYEEAIASYDEALEIKPEYDWAWNSRGNCFYELKQYEAAIASYDKALEIRSVDYIWFVKGNCLFELKQHEAAIASYEKAIEVKPDYAYAWACRGDALMELKRYEEAISSYNKAIAIKSDSHWVWVNKGSCLLQLKRYEEAIASYDKALEIKSDDHWAWVSRGYALEKLKRYEEAVVSCDKALESDPDYAYAWASRGNALEKLKRYGEAIASYDKALESDPDFEWTWTIRGNTLKKLKRYGEAIASYDKAVEIKPDYDYAWAGRGDALYKLKRYEEAIASYDKALEFKYDPLLIYLNKIELYIKTAKLIQLFTTLGKLIFKTGFKYAALFVATIIVLVLFYGKGNWFALFKQGLLVLLSIGILWMIVDSAWEKRTQLGFVFKTYFKSGILSYFRAFLNIVAMITTVTFFYIYTPDFLKWGWGSLVFGSSGNITLQPINTVYEASQKANEVFETETSIPSPTITPSQNKSNPKEDVASPANPTPSLNKTRKSPIDFRWLFLTPLWLVFMIALPFWAQAEERMFRQGVHSWRGMIVNSIKFGLIHLIMGIPIYIALALSVPGFLFACRYKYAYHWHLKRFKDEIKAQEAGVLASTVDHAIYNAILITFLFLILLLEA